MAYIRPALPYNPQDELQKKQQSIGTTAGGGMLGSEAPTVGKGQGQQKSTAGTPGGWYNIQDFFKANPQGGQQIKTGIEQRIGEDISKAKAAVQPGQFAAAVPAPMEYAKNAPLTDYESIKKGITQTYTPRTEAELYKGPGFKQQQEQIEALKPGQMQTFANYFGKEIPEQYTPGMSKMDLALLGQEKDWLSQLPGTVQSRFQQEVVNPYQSEMAQRLSAETANKAATEQARQGWQSAVEDFLGEKVFDIQNKLSEQQFKAAPINELYQSVLAGNYGDVLNKLQGLGYTPEQTAALPRDKIAEYLSITPGAVSKETAAQEALGSEGITQFNKLYDILSGVKTPAYGQITGQELTPGRVSFDWQRALQEQGILPTTTPKTIGGMPASGTAPIAAAPTATATQDLTQPVKVSTSTKYDPTQRATSELSGDTLNNLITGLYSMQPEGTYLLDFAKSIGVPMNRLPADATMKDIQYELGQEMARLPVEQANQMKINLLTQAGYQNVNGQWLTPGQVQEYQAYKKRLAAAPSLKLRR